MHSRHRSWKTPFLLVAVAACVTSAVEPTFASASPAHPSAPSQARLSAPSAPAAATRTNTVQLVTGDTVTISTASDGHRSVTVHPVSPASGRAPTPFESFASGGDNYVVPGDAVPYYGTLLDPSLFDVTAPRPATFHVTWKAGAARHSLPAPGRAFGAALARQAAADRASGHTGGGLFAGVSRISAPSATAPSATTTVNPAYLMHTVTIHTQDWLGKPVGVNATATLQNLDDQSVFQATSSYYQGRVSFSVPAGHYTVIVGVRTWDNKGNYVNDAMVVNPQVTVGGDLVLTMNARDATNRVWVPSTPRATSIEQMQVMYIRTTSLGQQDTYDQMLVGGTPIMYVSPTVAKQVTVGALHYATYFRLNGPGDSPAYTYDLEWPSAGAIPASSPDSADPATLATLTTNHYSDVPGRPSWEMRDSFQPWQSTSFRSSNPPNMTAPASRTEYVSALPNVIWQDETYAYAPEFNMITTSSPAIYQPGEQVSGDVLKAPLHPDVAADPVESVPCGACRQGNAMQINMSPWAGNQPGSAVTQVSPSGSLTESASFKLYQDGQLVASKPNARNLSFGLSPDPASYRLELDATKQASWSATSATSQTAWTFQSQPATGTIPSQRRCADRTQNCTFVPLLFLGYDVPVDLLNTIAAAGPVAIDVDVHGQPGQAVPTGTALTFQVSFDDGTSWTPAKVTPAADGHFSVSYTQPAATTGYVSFRAVATDSAGNSVEQTIIRAYQRTPGQLDSAPAAPTAPATYDACAALPGPYAHCFAVVNAAASQAAGQPAGYGPADLASAYNLPTSRGAGQTVAIVDAFDDPNAEADLAAYRQQYGLPPCTTDNGCFSKVNQQGAASPLPMADPGWGTEISLDLDMVSAVCPNCRILLVEGNTPGLSDLGSSVDTAVKLGADVVSNSYGTSGEIPNEQTFQSHYHHPGHAIVASAGDFGYNASYPAVSNYVTAVGGTTLNRSGSSRGWDETVWSGTGGGCSAYFAKPSWQSDPYCGTRMMNDVSAVADPATGVAIYDTFGQGGWLVVGGTSAGAPIIAAGYALAGNANSVTYGSAPYQHPGQFYDVTSGTNKTQWFSCGGDYICAGAPGYDGPTGVGTPNGVGGL